MKIAEALVWHRAGTTDEVARTDGEKFVHRSCTYALNEAQELALALTAYFHELGQTPPAWPPTAKGELIVDSRGVDSGQVDSTTINHQLSALSTALESVKVRTYTSHSGARLIEAWGQDATLRIMAYHAPPDIALELLHALQLECQRRAPSTVPGPDSSSDSTRRIAGAGTASSPGPPDRPANHGDEAVPAPVELRKEAA